MVRGLIHFGFTLGCAWNSKAMRMAHSVREKNKHTCPHCNKDTLGKYKQWPTNKQKEKALMMISWKLCLLVLGMKLVVLAY